MAELFEVLTDAINRNIVPGDAKVDPALFKCISFGCGGHKDD